MASRSQNAAVAREHERSGEFPQPRKAHVHRPGAQNKTRRNPERANRVIEFIQCLIVPSGEGQGLPFKLQLFQKDFIRAIYEPHGLDGKRVVDRAILSIARKNGKTALIAALVLVHLYGPEAVENGEVYSVANDRKQAAQVFKMAAQMVRAEPELVRNLKVVDSTKRITNYSNGSFFEAMSAEAGTKHGLNPNVWIYDELAQSKNRDLYDAFDTSQGAQSEPLGIVISTQSHDPEHVLSKMIDDGLNARDPSIVCHVYAVPDDAEDVWDESLWKLANPALGKFRSWKDLRSRAAKAARSPADEPAFRNLYLNQRVSPVSSLLAKREWMECKGPAEFKEREEVYLGLDLSSVSDLTALAMVSAGDKSRVKVWMWKPQEWLREHSNRDFGHGNWRYEQWHKAGLLESSPGRTIDHTVVAMKLAEIMRDYTVLGCAYDRHKIDYLIRDMDRIDVQVFKEGDKGSGLKLVPWGQGFISMGPAVDALEAEVLERTLEHSNSELLNWTIGNAVVITDPAGNRKLDKDKARFRIDPAVALAMAVGLKARDKQVPPKTYQMLFVG